MTCFFFFLFSHLANIATLTAMFLWPFKSCAYNETVSMVIKVVWILKNRFLWPMKNFAWQKASAKTLNYFYAKWSLWIVFKLWKLCLYMYYQLSFRHTLILELWKLGMHSHSSPYYLTEFWTPNGFRWPSWRKCGLTEHSASHRLGSNPTRNRILLCENLSIRMPKIVVFLPALWFPSPYLMPQPT